MTLIKLNLIHHNTIVFEMCVPIEIKLVYLFSSNMDARKGLGSFQKLSAKNIWNFPYVFCNSPKCFTCLWIMVQLMFFHRGTEEYYLRDAFK